MRNNKLVVAAAGSGKTTFLVEQALRVRSGRVLIATYTEVNERELRRRFLKVNGRMPSNITIQTWFSFLLQHGVRPFQSVLNDSIHDQELGFFLINEKSGRRGSTKGRPFYWGEDDFAKYYFTKSFKIYSDKVSKFVVRCNKASGGDVFNRLSRIYGHFFIDEVQDLAGFDLEILKLLFKEDSSVLLVGDPRQVTYLTHNSTKHKKYAGGKIRDFVIEKLGKRITCEVDETSLKASHRNSQEICEFSNMLYPQLPSSNACTCEGCKSEPSEHDGLFWIAPDQVDEYLRRFQPMQLRWSSRTDCNHLFPVMNFGQAKGRSFKRVLIYPTQKMKQWLMNHDLNLKDETRAKLYVAITRARRSVGFLLNPESASKVDELNTYCLR